MDDDRVWAFEKDLWLGNGDVYRKGIDPEARMALPEPPFIFSGEHAIAAVEATPRWSNVAFEDGTIARPQYGLIVVAYTAHAQQDGHDAYVAHCTTTYRLNDDHGWRVIQHQQTPKLITTAAT
jgi:hypothetical protein